MHGQQTVSNGSILSQPKSTLQWTKSICCNVQLMNRYLETGTAQTYWQRDKGGVKETDGQRKTCSRKLILIDKTYMFWLTTLTKALKLIMLWNKSLTLDVLLLSFFCLFSFNTTYLLCLQWNPIELNKSSLLQFCRAAKLLILLKCFNEIYSMAARTSKGGPAAHMDTVSPSPQCDTHSSICLLLPIISSNRKRFFAFVFSSINGQQVSPNCSYLMYTQPTWNCR